MWCIYRITNLLNGKTYIGQHQYEHLNDGYFGSGKILIKAIAKYGKENFAKDILVSKIPNRKGADYCEKLYIQREREYHKAQYNILDGGQGFTGNHTDLAKQKISNSMLGNQRAKGKNLNNQNAKGNILSEETRKQMGLSRMGNSNNGITLIQCIETGEIHRTREWIRLGYQNAYSVAYGRQRKCKGLHFKLVV